MLLPRPTLELNWLRRGWRKALPVPNVLLIDDRREDYGGCFWSPRRTEVEVAGGFYDLRRGLIMVNTIDESAVATLAHEWRHHEQHQALGPLPASEWSTPESPADYRAAIIAYFTRDPAEMDALLFEVKRAPCDTNLERLDWIHDAAPDPSPP